MTDISAQKCKVLADIHYYNTHEKLYLERHKGEITMERHHDKFVKESALSPLDNVGYFLTMLYKIM